MQDLKWAKANGLGFLIADTARLMRKRFDQRAREVGHDARPVAGAALIWR